MCFYHDHHYYPGIYSDETGTATMTTKCYECGDRIHRGQTVRSIYMRQYEECKHCGVYEGEDDPDKCEDGCSYGEEFECDICERCTLLLAAIREVEVDAGCTESESQPAFGELRESFWESDHAVDYIDRAAADYPELALSGHLDEFYRLTREQEQIEEEAWDSEDLEPVDEFGGESG